jgi:hypothetical protein
METQELNLMEQIQTENGQTLIKLEIQLFGLSKKLYKKIREKLKCS